MVDETDEESVNLVIGEARLEAGKELTKYFITEDPILVNDKDKGVDLKIVFKRRLSNEALMTFLPSFLLIAISYATSYFRLPNFFNTAITVNLTVMLTVTTLLISVVSKLSQTSYIKWIEAWLIFAQLIPFTQVLLITILERCQHSEEQAAKVGSCPGLNCAQVRPFNDQKLDEGEAVSGAVVASFIGEQGWVIVHLQSNLQLHNCNYRDQGGAHHGPGSLLYLLEFRPFVLL